MPINFDPTNVPDQPDDYPLLPIGEYDAIVASAAEKTSKAGNDMIVLTLEIDHDGRTYKVWDYLTFSEAAMGVVKIKCSALGMSEAFESGTLGAEQFLGVMCRVRIRHQRSEEYGVSEKVASYIGGTPAKKPAPQPEIPAEDIPF